MKICHVCKFECEDNSELCPVCGADLSELAQSEMEDIAENVNESGIIIKNPVLVATLEDVVSAEIFKDILKENGVPFTTSEENSDGSMRVVFGGGFASEEIYVDNDNLEIAEKLYEEFLESETGFEDFFDSEEVSEE